ncbi:MAG TPA: hypothetical protein VLF95_13605, partial [Vicinamibacteria bacterium]|nr:hypothetical protein [Vicinamibacteria bacterium]
MSAIPGTGSGRWKGSVHSRVRILDLALLLALAACGSGVSPATPTAPTASTAAPPTPQTLTVVNGLNHSVTVPALEVAVDSQRYVTDGGGTLTASVGSGSTIATSGGAGFVERETTYGGESELALWPLEGSWDAAYYRAIVYDRPWSSGLAPLVRPEPGVFSVSVSAAIASDPAALGMVKAALSEVARVT